MSEEPKKKNILSQRYSRAFVEVACPSCNRTKIICLPEEEIPKCEYCKTQMVIREILTEGKY